MSSEMIPRPRPTDEAAERALVAALRQRKGRATVGDLVVATGLPKLTTENVLRTMLGRYRSHLAVDANGELLYLFDPALRRRDGESKLRLALARAATFLWWLFTLICKVGVMVVLVGYFVLFVVLALAAIVAAAGKDSRSRGRDAGALLHVIFRVVLEVFIVTEYRRVELRRKGRTDPRPFYKKVFSFAFGPVAAEQWGLPRESPRSFERDLLATVRTLLGVLSPSELVRYTGWSLRRADEESTRLLADYEGEPEVTEDGVILYRFPGLLASAGGQAAAARAEPWYRTKEQRALVTGNTTGTNVFIGFMNGFNLLASGFCSLVVLQEPGYAAIPIWLTWIPLFFSLVLFTTPALRSFAVARENRRRLRRNVRRVLLGSLFADADRGREPRLFPARLPDEALRAAGGRQKEVAAQLELLLRELEGEPEADEDGRIVYRFPRLLTDVEAARTLRKQVDPASLQLGEIVYTSEE